MRSRSTRRSAGNCLTKRRRRSFFCRGRGRTGDFFNVAGTVDPASAEGQRLQHHAGARRAARARVEAEVQSAAGVRRDSEGGLQVPAGVLDELLPARLSLRGPADSGEGRPRHPRADDSGRHRLHEQPHRRHLPRVALLSPGRRGNAKGDRKWWPGFSAIKNRTEAG